MVIAKLNRKLNLILLYLISIFFFPLIIIPILLHIRWKKKDREFLEVLHDIGFNNYKEIETGSLKYLIFNEDGRFMEVKGYDHNLYDIRDYDVELSIPDSNGAAANALLAYYLIGPIGTITASNVGNNYLILRKKGVLEEPLKFRIYGKKSGENLINFLIYYKDKGYIQIS